MDEIVSLGKRLADYVRMIIEIGELKLDSPVGIAYRDFIAEWNKTQRCSDETHAIKRLARYTICPHCSENLTPTLNGGIMEDKPQETKLYVGTKLIRGAPMDRCTFLKTMRGEDVTNLETEEGYLVIYPDGYKSWSPKKAFDDSHRLVTPTERALIL